MTVLQVECSGGAATGLRPRAAIAAHPGGLAGHLHAVAALTSVLAACTEGLTSQVQCPALFQLLLLTLRLLKIDLHVQQDMPARIKLCPVRHPTFVEGA